MKIGILAGAVMAVSMVLLGCGDDGNGNPSGSGSGNGSQFNPNITYGTLADSRDDKMYRTVVMPDGKTWMAENLNYNASGSWCYDNSADSCAKYGRLYD